jgi:hypothetical protein
MSKEMWDFDAEGAGEIMFNKVVNGFLPDLFKRWMKINARHLVTIILFTRMSYDGEPSLDEFKDTTSSAQFGQQSPQYRDYYRVVVSDMASGDWINILYQLKKEFRAFLRDVSLVPKSTRYSSSSAEGSAAKASSALVISGKPKPASQGNILEAINLAAAQFAKDYIDRDLVRTGISVVVITAGTGVFEVDYNMLKLTTDTLIGSGIGIDLVCLSPMPLHSVPLFKYRSPRIVSDMKITDSDEPRSYHADEAFGETNNRTPRQSRPNFGSVSKTFGISHPELLEGHADPTHDDAEGWRYAMPHWLDISFWSGPSGDITELAKPIKSIRGRTRTHHKGGTFALRCRMYELQMMGVMENELGGISIPYMEESSLYPHQLTEHLVSSITKGQERSRESKARMKPNGSYSLQGTTSDAEGQLERSTSLYKDWMDTYDKNVFNTAGDDDAQNSPPPLLERFGTRASPEKYPSDALLSTSFRSVTSSTRHSKRQTPERSFHPLGRELSHEPENESPRSIIYRPVETQPRAVPRADVLYRQLHSNPSRPPQRVGYHQHGGSGDSHDYRESLRSTPNDSPAASRPSSPPRRSGLPALPSPVTAPTKAEPSKKPGGWFLRQISFGARGAGVAKPAASAAAIDITPGDVKPARLTVENNQKGAIAAKLASTRPTETETASKPIAIRSATRPGALSAELPSSEEAARSVETVRGTPLPKPSVETHRGSATKDPGSTFLLAGSRALAESIGPKLDITTSGGGKDAPRTLSPTSAIAPWAVLVNPCNPKKNPSNVASQFRRWQHVFPKQLKTASVKWKSLCSPAAVPLTNEYFPSTEQLATEYNESPYKIAQNEDDDAMEAPKSRETLIRELIAFRLSHGFQIIVGPKVAEVTGRREQDLSNILHSDYMSNDGDTVFMCVGNTIHQLVCAAGGEVEVKRFSRKPTTALQSSAGIDTPFPYKPFIRTAFEDKYQSRDIILRPPRKEYNWNFIDTFLAGYHDEFSDILRFWRARFVLIPVEIPSLHRRTMPQGVNEDSEEEIRLEGIRKLTQLWQKHRYIAPEERQHFQATSSKRRKDPNPLAIEYHTRDPSAIVAAGPDGAFLTEVDTEFQTSIFSEDDQYSTSNIDLKRLAEDLQSEKGIPMLDRRWHWRLHYNCFLGSDLTSWLLSNFRDIETRDEAVELGNQLMNKGLFQHVQKRHQFRDGQFFFQIAPEYRAPRPDTRAGWFGMKKTDRSIPSTPLSEGPRTSPLTGRNTRSRPSVDDSSSASGSLFEGKEGEKTPTRAISPKRKVTLSRVMRYDVDSRKRSYRPEIISLHYDRLHNPDNCYHIRIDWMNVTAKLIEDAIVTWATSVEKYGLKLVEVPIAEASNIVDHHPFRSPYPIRLALQPPKTLPERIWDPSHFSPQPRTDPFVYHKALLRKMNFVLDMEAASAFPPDVEVTYSWGKPDYKYTQFVHRSGGLLAQITTEGDFLLLANRLAHNRAKDTTKFRPTDPYDHKRTAPTPTNPSTPAIDKVTKSPFSSPLARPVQDSSLLHTALQSSVSSGPSTQRFDTLGFSQTPEQIKDEFEAFCSDPIRLRQFYEHALQQTPGPSPHIGPVLDSNIPSLGLPPAINIKEASPAGSSGWALMQTPRIEAPTSIARRYGGNEGGGTGSAGSGSGSSAVTAIQKRPSTEGTSLHRRRDSQGSRSSGTGMS